MGTEDWRKCIYCGRYVSYADIESKKAVVRHEVHGSPTALEPVYQDYSYHEACKQAKEPTP